MLNRIFLAMVFIASLSAPVVNAEDAEDARPSHPCAAITEPSERLACYDAMFPVVEPASSLSNSALSSDELNREKFGLTKQQRQEKALEPREEQAPKRIEDSVASVQRLASGKRLVELESGQSWLLTENTSKGQLKSGDRVVIRKAALGTFMLVTPANYKLRARRID